MAVAGLLEPQQGRADCAKRDRKYAVIAIDEHCFDVRSDLSLASQMVSCTKWNTGSGLSPCDLFGHEQGLALSAVYGIPRRVRFPLIRATVVVPGVPHR